MTSKTSIHTNNFGAVADRKVFLMVIGEVESLVGALVNSKTAEMMERAAQDVADRLLGLEPKYAAELLSRVANETNAQHPYIMDDFAPTWDYMLTVAYMTWTSPDCQVFLKMEQTKDSEAPYRLTIDATIDYDRPFTEIDAAAFKRISAVMTTIVAAVKRAHTTA